MKQLPRLGQCGACLYVDIVIASSSSLDLICIFMAAALQHCWDAGLAMSLESQCLFVSLSGRYGVVPLGTPSVPGILLLLLLTA